jgi:hypothetical protein
VANREFAKSGTQTINFIVLRHWAQTGEAEFTQSGTRTVGWLALKQAESPIISLSTA